LTQVFQLAQIHAMTYMIAANTRKKATKKTTSIQNGWDYSLLCKQKNMGDPSPSNPA